MYRRSTTLKRSSGGDASVVGRHDHRNNKKHTGGRRRSSLSLHKFRTYLLIRWMRSRTHVDIAVLSSLLFAVTATLLLSTTNIMTPSLQSHYGKYRFTPPMARWDVHRNRPVSLLRRTHDDDDDPFFANVTARAASSRIAPFTPLPPGLRHTFRVIGDKGRREVHDVMETRHRWRQVMGDLDPPHGRYGRRRRRPTTASGVTAGRQPVGTGPTDRLAHEAAIVARHHPTTSDKKRKRQEGSDDDDDESDEEDSGDKESAVIVSKQSAPLVRANNTVTPSGAQIVANFGFTDRSPPSQWSKHIRHPYERIGFIPGMDSRFSDKDSFLRTFRDYADRERARVHPPDENTDPIWFVPQGYRITRNQQDRETLRDLLRNGRGMELPWVLKKTDKHNGLGVQMLAPHSKQLRELSERLEHTMDDLGSDYIVQQYICNELTWFEGQKFDLRMFFLVASVDPLIVLFEDGHARVSKGTYDEAFDNMTQTALHLTNGQFQQHVSFDQHYGFEFLWFRIRKHYEQHHDRLHGELGITDPVAHIRNQLKEAIGRFVEAFVGDENLLDGINKMSNARVKVENAFGFYGSDFIIDADLDIWFIEAQASPAIGSYYQYRIDTWARLFPAVFHMVDEIQMKQEKDPNANVLPLETRGGWEIVYAGGQGFRYKGYKRMTTKKSCTPKPPPKLDDGDNAQGAEENDQATDKTNLFANDKPKRRGATRAHNKYSQHYIQYGRWEKPTQRRKLA